MSEALWTCVQAGAREHFAIPRLLHRAGRLDRLYTDLWLSKHAASICRNLGSNRCRRLAGRRHDDLPDSVVSSWNIDSILRQVFSANNEDPYRRFLDEGRWLSQQARDEAFKSADRSKRRPCIFSYDTTALEIFDWARASGGRCVLGQMDPGKVEIDRVRTEARRWPGWQDEAGQHAPEYERRREEEWQRADRIVVNSEFCRRALQDQGVPVDKLIVVPLCYEPCNFANAGSPHSRHSITPRSSKATGPLRVLYLGQVNLRKGIPYLLSAAQLLRASSIQFTVAGPVQISRQAVDSALGTVQFVGPVARTDTTSLFATSDLFVLPTVSDGFAITQIEAMAHGLPVISTPNCGEVVRNGVDGLVVPAGDAYSLAEAIRRFADDREFLAKASHAALERSGDYTLEKVSPAWLQLFDSLTTPSRATT